MGAWTWLSKQFAILQVLACMLLDQKINLYQVILFNFADIRCHYNLLGHKSVCYLSLFFTCGPLSFANLLLSFSMWAG